MVTKVVYHTTLEKSQVRRVDAEDSPPYWDWSVTVEEHIEYPEDGLGCIREAYSESGSSMMLHHAKLNAQDSLTRAMRELT